MAVTAFAELATVPAVASAVTVWVSPEMVKPPFNSCAAPQFNAIQTAIAGSVAGTEIRVCKGTYAEQLTIEKEFSIVGEAGVIVTLPASPANSTSTCDIQKAGEYEEQDLVTICGAGKVTVSGVTLEARWTGPANCAKRFFGVLVGGNANLTLTESKVLHAAAEPINGCQQGNGVQVGRERNGQVASATLTNDQISGYQKTGIGIDNKGSTASIAHVTVTGRGPAPLAQNGIQVSRGAVANITESTITANQCNIAKCGDASLEQFGEDATGVLFYKEAKGSTVTKSVISGNDLGVAHAAEVGAAEPQATISEDILENDRYASIMLDQGFATVSKDTMTGGNVGILLVQYAAQEFGTMGYGTKDKIKKMTKRAIEGLSDLSPSDQFGSFTITKSKIRGNPKGASLNESVFTNNPSKLQIVLSHDH